MPPDGTAGLATGPASPLDAVFTPGARGRALPVEGIASMKKFKVGDVVQLISGGPKMLVVGGPNEPLEGVELVECFWFTKDDELRRSDFHEDFLVETTAKIKAGAS